jgi:phage FluMu protein Com
MVNRERKADNEGGGRGMCFRPGGVAKPIECPNCGKKIPIVGGVVQKKCPFCKTVFTEDMFKEEEEAEDL